MSRVWMLIGLAFANAVRGIRSARATSALAVLTIAVVLVLVGSSMLLVANMNRILDDFGSDLQVTVFLEPGVTLDDQRDLAIRIGEAEGVERVEMVTRDQALERFERIAGSAELLAGLEENPLPASLEIFLRPEARNADSIARLAAVVDALPGVEDLAHGQEWIEGYTRALSLIQGGSTLLSVVLGLAALLIVANTIRLAVYARRDELDILALVGASRTFVRVPFLMEGTLQGLLGGLLALGLLFVGYELLLPQVRYGLEMMVGRAELRFFSAQEMIRLVGAGSGLGLLGSMTALVGWRG